MLVWCLDAAGQQDIEAIVREYGVNTLAFRQSCFFACCSPRNQIPIFIAFVDHQSLILFLDMRALRCLGLVRFARAAQAAVTR
jgi:hypothetical protein